MIYPYLLKISVFHIKTEKHSIPYKEQKGNEIWHSDIKQCLLVTEPTGLSVSLSPTHNNSCWLQLSQKNKKKHGF